MALRPLMPDIDSITRCMTSSVIRLRELASRWTSRARMRTASGIMPGLLLIASAGRTPRASFCCPAAP